MADFDWGSRLPTLSAPRVTLRWIEDRDVPALFGLFSHPAVMRYWSGPPLVHEDAARELLEGIRVDFARRTLFQWGVALNDSDELAGTLTLFRVDTTHRRAELGFALRPQWWGRGLMREAIDAAVAFAFGPLDLERLEADVDPRNERSLRLLQRAGFHREGLLRGRYRVGGEVQDAVLLGLLRSEWQARPHPDNGSRGGVLASAPRAEKPEGRQNAVLREFGHIDIYLFDQLQRGRIRPGDRIVDAGCGGGRNLVYLLREGYDVHAIDADARAVAEVRSMAAILAPGLPADRFRVEPVEAMGFPDAFADVVISSAVLHFARDAAHFDAMVREMWRVVRPGGVLFARLATDIGIADRVVPIGDGRYVLPDGSERFLASERTLMDLTRTLGGDLLDPIKTTLVQDQRSMTTWVVRRR